MTRPSVRSSPVSAGLLLGLAASAAAIALVACGGKVVVDHDEGSGVAGGGASTTTTSTTSTSTTSGGLGGASGDGFTITFAGPPSAMFDCMPVVGPDPVNVKLTVAYDNTQGSETAEATITAGHLLMSDPSFGSLAWTFALAPSGSGPVGPGQSIAATHSKVPGSGSGQGDGGPCNYCGATGELQLDMQSPPIGSFTIGLETPIGCAL